MMDERATLHGMSIDDAYVVERRLARGPEGTTELVTLDGAGPFVRKRIPIERVRRDVWAALAACASPYLPRVQATYELPDEFVVVLDYVSGETLAERVAQAGPCPIEDVRRLVEQLAQALSQLHGRGVVHGDVAPSNVVMASDGAHLIDFGNACMAGMDAAGEGGHQGTWGFAAPEQHGFAAIDVRADVYALSRLATYALTGALPEGNTQRELRAHIAALPSGVRAVLERACAFEPSARYDTVRAFAATFDAACTGGVPSGEQVSQVAGDADAGGDGRGVVDAPRPAEQPGPRSRPLRMRPVVAAAIVVALVAVLAVGATFVLGGVGERAAAPGMVPDTETGAAEEAGQQSDAAAGADAVARAQPALELVETAWAEDGSGLFTYAFVIQNTSTDLRIDYAEIAIVGRDAAGSVVSSDSMVLNTLHPGETQYVSGIAGNGQTPVEVTFDINPLDETMVFSTAGTASVYGATARLVDDGLGGMNAVGEVTLERTGDDQELGTGLVAVTALVRDDAGAIAASGETYVDMPAEGSSSTFEVPVFPADASGTLEVHARMW